MALATTKRPTRVSDRILLAQIARKLTIAWALVDEKTNQLRTICHSRSQARTMKRPGWKVRRIDLRIKGLQP
jgi:hypothetical protein